MSPKHQGVADSLRSRIASNDFGSTGKLPSDSELVSEYGVSRTTVRTALQALMAEGLIRSEIGIGYFVRVLHQFSYRPQNDLGVEPEINRFMKAAPPGSGSQTIEVGMIPAPDFVAERLQISESDLVAYRKRIRFIDDEPYITNDSYYPRKIVDGTAAMTAQDVAGGVNKLLERLGHGQVRALDQIYVQMPSLADTNRLSLLPGTPVAIHLITGYTADERPVRVVRNVLPGDRVVVEYERASIG